VTLTEALQDELFRDQDWRLKQGKTGGSGWVKSRISVVNQVA